MIGDEVMAFFIPAFGADYRRTAALAAHELARAVGYGGRAEPWLRLGIGVHAGPAFVGRGRLGTG
jgi:adenylate cyclase